MCGACGTKERGLMVLGSIAFLAAIFVIACAILGSLCFVCRHSQQQSEEKKPGKKFLMSDFK
jgi:hypothetical protein